MEIEKKNQPDKFLPKHEADPVIAAGACEPGYAFFSFNPDGAHSLRDWFKTQGYENPLNNELYLRFTEDECRRWAYIFEQAADIIAGRVVRQSDESYTVRAGCDCVEPCIHC